MNDALMRAGGVGQHQYLHPQPAQHAHAEGDGFQGMAFVEMCARASQTATQPPCGTAGEERARVPNHA